MKIKNSNFEQSLTRIKVKILPFFQKLNDRIIETETKLKLYSEGKKRFLFYLFGIHLRISV